MICECGNRYKKKLVKTTVKKGNKHYIKYTNKWYCDHCEEYYYSKNQE